MAQNKVDNIQINAPKDIDNKRGVWANGVWRPYNDLTEVFAKLPIGIRYPTQTVLVYKAGVPTEYWWRDTLNDDGLIEKVVGFIYTLPTASPTVLGGVKVGESLTINPSTGELNVNGGGGGGGAGSVTSVGMTSSDLNISGSPITSAGTITANIKNTAVTFVKMQTVPSGVILGRGAVGSGVIGTITIGTGLSLSSSNVLTATGGGGGGSQTLQQTLNLGRVGDSMQITNSLQIPVTPPAVINTGDIWIGSGTTSGGGGGGYVLPIASSTVLGGVKVGSGLSINATTGELSATGGGTGSVTSVGLSAPTGLTVSNSPVTTSGTIALTLTSGYSIPTTTNQTNWSTAYTHSQTINANPHLTSLQQVLTVANTGTAMKITASMEIPTVAPTTIQAGSIWIGSGTSA